MVDFLRGAAKTSRIKELEAGLRATPDNRFLRLELNRLLSGGPTAQRATAEEQARRISVPTSGGRTQTTLGSNTDAFSLAKRFYGNRNLFSLILNANPRIGQFRQGMTINIPLLRDRDAAPSAPSAPRADRQNVLETERTRRRFQEGALGARFNVPSERSVLEPQIAPDRRFQQGALGERFGQPSFPTQDLSGRRFQEGAPGAQFGQAPERPEVAAQPQRAQPTVSERARQVFGLATGERQPDFELATSSPQIISAQTGQARPNDRRFQQGGLGSQFNSQRQFRDATLQAAQGFEVYGDALIEATESGGPLPSRDVLPPTMTTEMAMLIYGDQFDSEGNRLFAQDFLESMGYVEIETGLWSRLPYANNQTAGGSGSSGQYGISLGSVNGISISPSSSYTRGKTSALSRTGARYSTNSRGQSVYEGGYGSQNGLVRWNIKIAG